MERTWKPTTAGILSIIAGVIGLLVGILLTTIGGTLGAIAGILGLGLIGAPLIAFGVIAIIGGVFALRRSVWGLALAGAICALPCLWILAIPAIVFIVKSKREFEIAVPA